MSRERDRNSSRSSRHHDYLIKLRGIPYSSNKDDIKKFLSRKISFFNLNKIISLIYLACRIITIHLFSNNGNSSSECLVDLESETDVKDALKKTNSSMGNRYIEGEI